MNPDPHHLRAPRLYLERMAEQKREPLAHSQVWLAISPLHETQRLATIVAISGKRVFVIMQEPLPGGGGDTRAALVEYADEDHFFQHHYARRPELPLSDEHRRKMILASIERLRFYAVVAGGSVEPLRRDIGLHVEALRAIDAR